MKYLAVILLILTNAGETIGYKGATGNAKDVAWGVTFWSVIFSLPVSLALMFFMPHATSAINWGQLGLLLIMSLIGVATIYFWAQASKHLPMSIAEGVSEIYIALLAIFCWLFFGKSLNIWQIVLISVVIMLCLILALAQCSPKSSTKYNTKLGFIFLAVWVGLSVIKGALPSAITGLSAATFVLGQNAIMLVVCLLIQNKRALPATKAAAKNPYIMFVALCRVVSQLSIFYLASRINLGLADAISVCGLVLIMLYERFVFKEKINPYCYPILILLIAATAALCVL